MMKPITKKVLFGLPAVVLTAALACTMVGCGGGSTDGTQGESGGEAPAEHKAYESQKVEVMGFTIESLADGTYYRGDVYKQDGFYLRVKITNNNEKAKQKTTVGAIAAFGELEATDPTFHGSAKGLLSFDLNKPEGLSEGAQIEGTPLSNLVKASSGSISGTRKTIITDPYLLDSSAMSPPTRTAA